jgi:two-component system chemotaxis sensor kinase CheA
MSLAFDDEIVQDYLVEAGEILDQLGEQLVGLESRPDDRALLNSIFRGFHTLKGGAGFLGFDTLVEVSHKAEDLFDLLRKGERGVDPDLMDAVLEVVDVLQRMFAQIRSHTLPERASAELLTRLMRLVTPGAAPPAPPAIAPSAIAPPAIAPPAIAPPAIAPPAIAPPPRPDDEVAVPAEEMDEEEFLRFLGTVSQVPSSQVPSSQGTAPPREAPSTPPTSPPRPASAPSGTTPPGTTPPGLALTGTTPPGLALTPEEYAALLASVGPPAVPAERGTGGHLPLKPDEFAALLDAVAPPPALAPTVQGAPASPPPAAASATAGAKMVLDPDTMSDDEFDAILNSLAHKRRDEQVASAAPPPAPVAKEERAKEEGPEARPAEKDKKGARPAPEPVAAPGEEIGDDEFEALLDQLHGRKQPVRVENLAPITPPVIAHRLAAPASRPAPPLEPAQIAAASAAVAEAAKSASAETTIRVETSVLDRMMNMVGEMVLLRNRLTSLQATINHPELTKVVSALDLITTDLQGAAMKTRMQPIKKVFGRFPRVVRDLARSLGKEVALELHGEDTELDKNLVEALADPLVHLVRNAVDHGVELPEARAIQGKPRQGTLRLTASQAGDHILLLIEDDGAGIDIAAVRRKAVSQGLLEESTAARLTERDCYDLLFLPGFSTKQEITDVSGRGVGMDVVKTRIGQLNGTIQVKSELGRGTRLEIRVPLTLAILPTLMVVCGDHQIFALPLVNVKEIVEFDRQRLSQVDDQLVMVFRQKALPIFYLTEWLVPGTRTLAECTGHIVVTSLGNQPVGLLVDQLLGREEVVIKALGTLLHGTRGVAGATITGDGRIALILDLPCLFEVHTGSRRGG